MRVSRFPLHTLKEEPAGAEIASHRLMLRAGLIQKLSSGLYLWLPAGLRVLRKVAGVVREEMDAAGACELLMPAVQPAELWRRSGRWDEYGPELLRLQDRHARDFVFGPTHEEVISHFAAGALSSYRQLPVNYYQIQTKFRDEIRPRFGVMRAREFLMKDAYSFHADAASLDDTYQAMFAAYRRIFDRLQLKYRAVLADTGAIGGSASHEFHILADSGEDRIAFSDEGDYAASVEFAPTAPAAERAAPGAAMEKIDTPGAVTIDALAEMLDMPPARCLKALFVNGADGGISELPCSRGVPLGVESGFAYDEGEYTMQPGEMLYLFTDGVSEAHNADSELYSEERLKKLLEKDGASADPVKIVDAVWNSVEEFRGETKRYDDITQLAVQYTGAK